MNRQMVVHVSFAQVLTGNGYEVILIRIDTVGKIKGYIQVQLHTLKNILWVHGSEADILNGESRDESAQQQKTNWVRIFSLLRVLVQRTTLAPYRLG